MKLSFKVLQEIAVIKEGKNGWKKELNLISWNDKEPKYDIRWWSENRKDIGKGMTFSPEEIPKLITVLHEKVKLNDLKVGANCE